MRKFGKDQFLFPFLTGPAEGVTPISTSDMFREQWELSTLLLASQLHTFEHVICNFPFLICQSHCFLLVFLFLQPFLSKASGTYTESQKSQAQRQLKVEEIFSNVIPHDKLSFHDLI